MEKVNPYEQLDQKTPITCTHLAEILKKHKYQIDVPPVPINPRYAQGQLFAIEQIRDTFAQVFRRLNPNDSVESKIVFNRYSPYFYLNQNPPDPPDRIDVTEIGIHWIDFLTAYSAIIENTVRIVAPKDSLENPLETPIKELIKKNPFFHGVVTLLDSVVHELSHQIFFLPGPEGIILIQPETEEPIKKITEGSHWRLPPLARR